MMFIDDVDQNDMTKFSSQLPLGNSAMSNMSPAKSTVLMDSEARKASAEPPTPILSAEIQANKKMRVSVKKNIDGDH